MIREMGLWMKRVDERVLENLSEEGRGTAWEISFNLGTNDRYVYHRLLVLADAEFVVRVPGEKVRDEWDITTWGEGYLSGEIDAEHRKPEPSPRPPDKVRPGWYAGFG
jgi:hypothetical protein